MLMEELSLDYESAQELLLKYGSVKKAIGSRMSRFTPASRSTDLFYPHFCSIFKALIPLNISGS